MRDGRRILEAANSSSEVVVSQADSLVGAGLSLDRLDPLLFYINTVTNGSSAVLSAWLVLFSGLSAVTFPLLLVLVWSHNQSAYKRRYWQWERSFLYQRCDFNGARILDHEISKLSKPSRPEG